MQVQCLEAANQRLRLQIQEQLDTKFHDELRTVSLLQHQVGECLSARAQVKLQLLGAELSVFHFSSRCEKVREHCRRLEAEIRDLRRRGEELRFHQLPRLQRLLNHGTEQQVELKIQHQQDVQGLLAQVSGEVAVGMQTDPSSDLIRQLDDLRQTSALLLDRNRDGRSSDPQTTLDPGEVIRAELAELRRMAAGLQDELTQLQNLTALLEDLCPEQTESLVLQQRADGLCRDLESVRQVAAQQADAQQALLDINNKLEAELRDYKRLLDGLSQERVSSLPMSTITSFFGSTRPAASRQVTPHRVFRVQGGTLQTMEVRTVSQGHIRTVSQTPAIILLLETVTTNKSVGVQCKHPRNSPLTLINTSKQISTHSIHNCENLRKGTNSEKTTRESIRTGQLIQGLDKGVGVKSSKIEIHPATTGFTKIIPGYETEIKQRPDFVTQTTASDPVKKTPAALKKATEAMTIPQINHINGHIQVNEPDPDCPSETVGKREDNALTPLGVSGFHCGTSDGSHGDVSSEVILMDDRDVERQQKKEDKERLGVESALLVLRFDQNPSLSDMSNSKQNKVQDAFAGSSIASDSSSSPVSNNTLGSKTASTEMIDLKMNTGTSVIEVYDSKEVKEAPIESVNQEVQEATESKKSTSLTDSGVALNSSDTEELLSPRMTEVFLCPTETAACLGPQVSLNLVDTDQVFWPVDIEDQIKSPNLLLSPNDPEMYLSLNESDTCLRPVETKDCLTPTGEEEDDDEEACLSLTEANARVRPVEKYILSTKDEGQTLLFRRESTSPEVGRQAGVSISVTDGESLCFGSFTGKEGSKGTLPDININSIPTSQRSDLQLGKSLGSLEFRGTADRSILAEKEKQSCVEGLNQKSGKDGRGTRHRNKDMTNIADNKVRSPGGRNNSGRMAGDLAASVPGTAANSSTIVSSDAERAMTVGLQANRSGSGECLLYGGSLRFTRMSVPRAGNEESQTLSKESVKSRPETGRFASRGSGEWMVNGGSLRRKSNLDAGTSLPSEENKESLSVATDPMRSPPEKGRFGGRDSGEWRVYGGSTGRMSSPARSYSLLITESGKNPSVATELATSPPVARRGGRFGSAGSGEWRVYGGSTERLSRAGSANEGQVISPPSSNTSSRPRLSSVGGGGRLSTSGVVRRSRSVGSAGKLSSSGSGGSSSPGSHRISSSGRFVSTGSGEWKPVYSSASGRRSSVGRSTSSQRALSPGGKMNVSGGSGGWLNSAGSGSKLSGLSSNERISHQAGGRISRSFGKGRTNSTGGRVISSSDRPIKSTGSGAGGNKERISVCKMAALSISAAGRERSQDRQRQAERFKQQQQVAATTPLVQRWLTTGVGVTSAHPDGLDDIMRL
ncbi:uncharacterized protein LOC118289073 isoform X2 [Scophthalmus maximus]|uniref:uncharacterized protein LOC118289073 isoform X2 n=1 Tax=Scophthalmus maximus TaxID=52904 RepID=UPI001FA8C495|nr:uncharacterized protein LOC118289073 isoform X2 [Scophthalmus maximus]